jgi:hypothetical protein
MRKLDEGGGVPMKSIFTAFGRDIAGCDHETKRSSAQSLEMTLKLTC